MRRLGITLHRLDEIQVVEQETPTLCSECGLITLSRAGNYYSRHTVGEGSRGRQFSPIKLQETKISDSWHVIDENRQLMTYELIEFEK
jgi:hypothetical protein